MIGFGGCLFQNLNIVKVVRLSKPMLGNIDEGTAGSITLAHASERVEQRPTWDELLPEGRRLSDMPWLVRASCSHDLRTYTEFHVSLTNSWVERDPSSPAATWISAFGNYTCRHERQMWA